MKKFLVLLATLFIFACGTQEETAIISTATLSGTITSPKAEKVRLTIGKDKSEATLTDGKFTMTIDLKEAGEYNFKHGSESSKIYLEPGDNISMTLNGEEFDESLSFEGTGAAVNNYLAKSYLLNETETGDFTELYKSDEATFVEKTANIRAKLESQLAEFQKENPKANKHFVANQKARLLYDWAGHRNRYQEYHQYYAKDKTFNVSDTYNDFKKELDLDNADLLSSSTYKSFIVDHYDGLANKIMEEDKVLKDDETSGWLKAQMSAFENHAQNPAVKRFLTFDALKSQISYVGTDGIESIFENFKTTSNDAKQNSELQEIWDKWAVLAKGKVAPDFEYADIEGKMIALKDFRGKHVYIDVWATWCGPCMRELPHLEKLQERYHGNENIVFASVSIDEDKEAWAKMVEEKEMQGVQLIGDEAWSSSICKDYLINGIPRFILIDKEGNIMNAKAPRPSSDEIKDVLKEISKPVLTSMK